MSKLWASDLELRQIAWAVAVADTGSFTQAASVLGVEVSAVSRRVRDLEDVLGLRLFDRTARGVLPTAAGHAFVQDARGILTKIAAARQRAREASAGKRGQLALGFVWSASQGPAAELISDFCRAEPELTFNLVEEGSESLMMRLSTGELDIALNATVSADRLIVAGVQDVELAPLWTERVFVVLPPSDDRRSIRWTDLGDVPVVYRRSDAAAAFSAFLVAIGEPRLNFVPQDCSHAGLLALVAAGVGVALVPESVADPELKAVRFAPIQSPGALLQVVAVWRRASLNPATGRFVAMAVERYGAREFIQARYPDAPSRTLDPSP